MVFRILRVRTVTVRIALRAHNVSLSILAQPRKKGVGIFAPAPCVGVFLCLLRAILRNTVIRACRATAGDGLQPSSVPLDSMMASPPLPVPVSRFPADWLGSMMRASGGVRFVRVCSASASIFICACGWSAKVPRAMRFGGDFPASVHGKTDTLRATRPVDSSRQSASLHRHKQLGAHALPLV